MDKVKKQNILICDKLMKAYGDHVVLNQFDMQVNAGEFVLIIGESGSGKSSLLNILGLLDTATDGTLTLFGKSNIKPFSRQAKQYLRHKISYLFQNFALIETETVDENLRIALLGISKSKQKERMEEALMSVGLSGYLNKKVHQCSGGEQQRIAIARLLLKSSELILCDEPTGSLDDKNKAIIMDILFGLRQEGKTIIMVSHDMTYVNQADQVIRLSKL